MKIPVFLAALAIALPHGSEAADRLETQIFKCRRAQDGVKRLECYDALLGGRSEFSKTTSKGKGKWRVEIKKSQIDDTTNVWMRTSAIKPFRSKFGRNKTAELYLVCQENKTLLYVYYDEFLTNQEITVTLRIDKQRAFQRTVNVSTDYNAWGLWNGGSSIPFIKQLYGKSRLLVRLVPHGESPVTVEFDLSGIGANIGPLRKSCGW